MKNYQTMAEDVFRRRDEYESRQKQKKKAVRRTVAIMACCCLVLLPGLLLWQTGLLAPTTAAVPDSSENSGPAAGKMIVKSCPAGAASSGIPSYLSPSPGEYYCFMEVNDARDYYEHRSDVQYLLAIDVFTQDRQVDGEELAAEYQRLSELGIAFYQLTPWEYQGENGEKIEYQEIAALLSESQLQDFPVNKQYGYSFRFVTNGDSSPVGFDEQQAVTSPWKIYE